MSYFAAGYYGTGYYGPGYWGGGGAAPAPATPDKHDGFDEDLPRRVRKELREQERRFRGERERLREVLTQAWDGPPGPVAAEVKALAASYVDVLESGALRIDYAALERRKREVLDGVLAFEAALRAEFAQRMAAYDADEDDVAILMLWS